MQPSELDTPFNWRTAAFIVFGFILLFFAVYFVYVDQFKVKDCHQETLDSLPVFPGAIIVELLDSTNLNRMGFGQGDGIYQVPDPSARVQAFYEHHGANCQTVDDKGVQCEQSINDLTYEATLTQFPRGTRVEMSYKWRCSSFDLLLESVSR